MEIFFRLVYKDEILNVEGSIQYMKTEKGWKAKTILIAIKENKK
jgi:hypothetical protein